eukprot:3298154-Pyramimonas_sp.AAC.1
MLRVPRLSCYEDHRPHPLELWIHPLELRNAGVPRAGARRGRAPGGGDLADGGHGGTLPDVLGRRLPGGARSGGRQLAGGELAGAVRDPDPGGGAGRGCGGAA